MTSKAFETKRKCLYVKAMQRNVVMVQICVCPDNKSSTKSQKYTWFKENHLSILMERLYDVILAKVLSDANTGKENIQDSSEIASGPNSSFHIQYHFKKRASRQFLVVNSPWSHRSNKDKLVDNTDEVSYSGGGYRDFTYYPEKLVVIVSQQRVQTAVSYTTARSTALGTCNVKEKTASHVKPQAISKYFSRSKDSVTGSAVKKQANLRNIVKKMESTEANKDDPPASSTVRLTRDSEDNKEMPPLPALLRETSLENTTKSSRDSGLGSSNYGSTCTTSLNVRSSAENISQDTSRKRPRFESVQDEGVVSDTQRAKDEVPEEVDDEDFRTEKPRVKHRNKKRKKDLMELDTTVNERAPVKTINKAVGDAIDKTANTKSNRAVQKPDVILNAKNYKTNTRGVHSAPQEHENLCCQLDDAPLEVAEKCPNNKNKDSSGGESGGLHNTEEREVTVVEDAEINCSGSSRTVVITIEDVVPDLNNISEVSELTTSHIEHLVSSMEKKLKHVFKGKVYCRRHEDYKKGGRARGDLAFQVRFGLFSDNQQEAIMRSLTAIFCSRHGKYLDYITKVLLPETFVLIYMKLFGGSRDEVEHLLMERQTAGCQQVTDESTTE